jgi:hypothetical protein
MCTTRAVPPAFTRTARPTLEVQGALTLHLPPSRCHLLLQHGVNLAPGLPGREAIARCRLKASVDAGWGSITLVQATLEGMAEVLRRCPNVQHIALASGHDIPVRMIR